MAAAAVVRAGAPAEVDACIAIWLAALTHRDGTPQQPPAVAELARKQFENRIMRFAVTGGDQPTGFALTTAGDVPGAAKFALLAVAPEAAGRGLGRALLVDAVEAARQERMDSIRLKVRSGNAAAIALYRSQGFAPQGEPAAHPLGGEPMITYRLELSRPPVDGRST